MNTRDDIEDAIRQYGRECENAVHSFRCATPDLEAVMALIEPHLRIAEELLGPCPCVDGRPGDCDHADKLDAIMALINERGE